MSEGQIDPSDLAALDSPAIAPEGPAEHHDHGWDPLIMRVQMYLPGGNSMYAEFPWTARVSHVKEVIYSHAHDASDAAGVSVLKLASYHLKVSSLLPNYKGSKNITDDSLTVENEPCLKYCRENRIVPKIALIRIQAPKSAQLTAEQILQEQVASLVGVDFSEIVDEEISLFRASMAKFREKMDELKLQETPDPRDKLVYLIPISLTSPVPPTAPETFLVKVRMPEQDVLVTCKVETKDSVDDTISAAYQKLRLKMMIAEDRRPTEFIFKLTGFEEYLFGSRRLIEYDCIRSPLKRQQEVDLSMWDLSRYNINSAILESSLMLDCPWKAFYDNKNGTSYYKNLDTNEQVTTDPRENWLKEKREAAAQDENNIKKHEIRKELELKRQSVSFDVDEDYNAAKKLAIPAIVGCEVFDDPEAIEPIDSLHDASVAGINRRLRVRPVGCESLYDPRRAGYSRICAKMEELGIAASQSGTGASSTATGSLSLSSQGGSGLSGLGAPGSAANAVAALGWGVWIEIALCFGGELLCNAKWTLPVPTCESPRWDEWLTFDISLCDLPMGARLGVTVWAGVWQPHKDGITSIGKANKSDSQMKRFPLAWVNVALMDRQGHMRQGIVPQRMFKDDCSNPLGSCAENYTDATAPIVFLEFDVFSVPLRFPTRIEQIELGAQLTQAARDTQKKFVTEYGTVANDLETADRVIVDQILGLHPLMPLEPKHKEVLWRNRFKLVEISKALPKFLRAVQWAKRDAVAEAYVLLFQWQRPPPLEALELLSVKFADPEVRRFAIECLEGLSDSEVIDLLPQLVQVLKSEPHLDSSLSRFLLARGLRNPFKVGHILFWLLKAEMHVAETSQRFGLLLEEFIKGCNSEYREKLLTECSVLEKLLEVCVHVTTLPAENRAAVARKKLAEVALPSHFLMPLDSKWAASGIIPEKCRPMDSKKVPLWLTFKNADPVGQNLVTMLKYGDDLRQDIVTLQMIRIMDKLWEREGLELRLNTYGVVATGDNVGVLEIVLNSTTYAKITEEAGGASKIFQKERVANWIHSHNPSEQMYKEAVQNFVHSAAAYCVATYVLGIGDRHDDNIMLTKKGHLFHIDFGHFLGHFKDFKKIPGVKIRRERTPFVFTRDWAFVMGGLEGQDFQKFQSLCCSAYCVLRRHANLFINMFAMMLSTGIPELQDEEDIQYMIDVLQLGSTDEEATQQFKQLIRDSYNNKFKLIDGYLHIVAHKKK
eukprot:c11415_g1_i1.p1 GENE.c11415_g1_i1~~c11415_g1_i1.p1  ORF type:complete len:1225 (+),score=358.02 c11415_g1_i1:46-3720(+)